MQPVYTVEKPGFKKLFSKLNPRYQLPSRKHSTDYEIPKHYNHVRDDIVKLKLVQTKYFSGTTDLWTSSTYIPYMTFTVHFIDEDWILQSFRIGTFPLYEDHTGQNIAKAVTDVLNNWDLTTDQLVATTTNNGTNIVAIFSSLEWLRVSCFGHNLNLAITKAWS